MNNSCQTLILGAGLSGLSLAHQLRQEAPDHRFLVLEQGDRAGGVIQTHREQGFTSEIGPHGFLDNCPESQTLLQETGLEKEAIKAPLIDFVRYVYLNGRLNLIPQTPGRILKAPLIPWRAKLRILADLWTPYLEEEPTVAKWVHHRFGPALLPYVDAAFTGTYAGDIDKLTIDSVMPALRKLERQYGSVLRGLLVRMRQKKKTGAEKFSMPAMTSFPGGMERLVERLAEPLQPGVDLHLQTQVTSVKRDAEGWSVTAGEKRYSAKNLAFCLPINASLRLLAEIVTDLPVNKVPLAWIASVVFGFGAGVKLPPGFGYLSPEQERRFGLGTLFSSNMFAGRAPEGCVITETLFGGRRHPEYLELDQETLAAKTLADVQDILNIRDQPVYQAVLRSPGGIPQLEAGYPKLLQWKNAIEKRDNSLFICGFGWGGIGVNDTIKLSVQTAKALITSQRQAHTTELKGLYF